MCQRPKLVAGFAAVGAGVPPDLLQRAVAALSVSPEVYLTYDRLSEEYGNHTLRVTTRQSFQFHGVVKSGLGQLMKGINESLSDTLAACGDVNRNVLAPPTPSITRLTEQVYEDAKRVSDALLPTTKAYHQIWVEGQPLKLEDDDQEDRLYGKTYLPRKFKVAFVITFLKAFACS